MVIPTFQMNDRPSNDRCVFLFGCDRSGTTLLRSMLNGHPELMISYEAPATVTLADTFAKHGLRATVDAMRTFPQFDLVNWLNVIDRFADSDELTLGDVVAAANQDLLRQNGKSIWGDKTPAYTRFLKPLADMYPNAALVHIVRDPRAVSASWIKTDWGPNTAFHAGREWCQRVGEATTALQRLPQNRWAVIRFEDLISNPTKALKPICDLIGVDFVPELLEARSKESDALPNQFFQELHSRCQSKVDPSRVQQWRSMDADQIKQIEAHSWHLMQKFNYEPCGHSAPSISRLDEFQCKLQNRFRRLVNQFRRRRESPLYPLPTM